MIGTLSIVSLIHAIQTTNLGEESKRCPSEKQSNETRPNVAINMLTAMKQHATGKPLGSYSEFYSITEKMEQILIVWRIYPYIVRTFCL